jgi:hypothetical protein
MRFCARVLFPSLLFFGAACTPQATSDAQHISSTDSSLSGCNGQASSTIPSDGNYDLTAFGGSNDASSTGTMSCGESTDGGNWYYAASRQRYGCGSHIQITANGKCVVAETDDYGPDVCVETAAGAPIIDASPLVAEALFGASSAGWSDHFAVHVVEVDKSTPLGACSSPAPTSPPPPPSTPDMSQPPNPDPGVTCYSYTLNTNVNAGVCVQSSVDSNWYQCTANDFVEIASESANGPLGACTATYPLN